MDGCFNSGLSIGFGHILDDIDTGYLLDTLVTYCKCRSRGI